MKAQIGSVYGRLTVISKEGKDKSGADFYKCMCICGKEKVTRGYSLTRGAVKSCGCIKEEHAWSNYTKHENAIEGAWAYYYKQCLRNAKHRNIAVELTACEYRELSQSNCVYCGEPPELRPVQRGRAAINASGVDRVNNSIGYTKDNSVPCCTWCNQSKKHYSVEYFINKCKAVANASIARN